MRVHKSSMIPNVIKHSRKINNGMGMNNNNMKLNNKLS